MSLILTLAAFALAGVGMVLGIKTAYRDLNQRDDERERHERDR